MLQITFRAPGTPGTYPVKVHIISTSVRHEQLRATLSFDHPSLCFSVGGRSLALT